MKNLLRIKALSESMAVFNVKTVIKIGNLQTLGEIVDNYAKIVGE